MVDINNVSFGYPGHGNLYENLSISLPQGSVYGLLGRNGSGKSTLLYLMAGLLRSRKGSILFMGDNVIKREPRTLGNMFILPEEFSLPKCNFMKYVKRYAPFYPRFSEETLKGCLAEFDMPYDMPMGELSMGNKKKAYVCFALATNVSLLLLDEPTNGLDIPSKIHFRRAVSKTMTDDKSVIISTHQVRNIGVLLDHLVIIDNGRLMLNTSTEEITRRYAFGERATGEPVDDAVYVQRYVGGNKVIVENKTGEDTPLDLEMLFTAAVDGKISIRDTENDNDKDEER